MAIDILRNVRLFTGGVDLTGRSTKIEISGEVEVKDVTTFGSYDSATNTIWKEVVAGLGSCKIVASGLWEAGTNSVDEVAWTQLGGVGAWTVASSGTVGSPVWLTNALEAAYELGGSPGDVAPWKAGVTSSGPLGRGQLAHPPGTARTATGNGTALQIGATATGQVLVASLHVLSVSGTTPSLTVAVQSDDNAGMSSPTTRATFTAATAVGAQYASVAGPITDDYVRVTWTISGTTPSFLFAAAVGIAK